MRILSILVILILVGWDLMWWLLGVSPLFPWQLRSYLKAHPNALLLDVRTTMEYDWFRVPGAVHAEYLLHDIQALKDVPADRPLVVICMTGHRSAIVAYKLKKAGFERVKNLTWGTLGWWLWNQLQKRISKIE